MFIIAKIFFRAITKVNLSLQLLAPLLAPKYAQHHHASPGDPSIQSNRPPVKFVFFKPFYGNLNQQIPMKTNQYLTLIKYE